VARWAVTLGSLLAAVLFLLPAVFFCLPLNLLPPSAMPAYGSMALTPLVGARLAKGQGMLGGRSGTDTVHWHWCPGEGVSAICAELSGSTGHLDAVIVPGWSGAQVVSLTFSRVSAGEVMGGYAPAGALMHGSLENLQLNWRGDCLAKGLAGVRGELALSSPGIPDQSVTVTGDGADTINLSGESVQGDLVLAGDTISGRLTLAFPGNPGRMTDVDVNRRLACEEGDQ